MNNEYFDKFYLSIPFICKLCLKESNKQYCNTSICVNFKELKLKIEEKKYELFD